jgi:hypothetical protein
LNDKRRFFVAFAVVGGGAVTGFDGLAGGVATTCGRCRTQSV